MDRDRTTILEVRNLRRSYGRFTRVEALRGVSFAVRHGEIFGLIGPDGAGKTSVIQTLAGVLVPHGGSASVDGLDVLTDSERIKQRVGYMPQGLGSNLYESLTVDENIEFFRDLRQLPRDVYQKNRAELLAVTRLAPFLDRRVANLSGGMRQKLALICTLIHLPDVLLLDEPTTGVDPISRQEFWQIVRRIVEERGTTVLLSTSYMDEAERCHRIALLHAGTIVAEGAPESVRLRAAGRFASLTAIPQPLALHILRHRPDVSGTEVFGDEIHLQFAGDLRQIELALLEQGVVVRELAIQEPGLEDVFLQLTSRADHEPVSFHFAKASSSTATMSIECREVSRRFGTFAAVDRVDLGVRRSEIFGLLEPTAGLISVGGVNVRTERERVWTAIGYMSQRFSLYQDLTVRQNVRLYADLYGISHATGAALMGHLGLEPFSSRLTRDLPTGVRQRVSLVCAVLHNPPIVFLDEPTSGVDPQARRVFWELIYSLSREAGVTVVVSTHYMDEAAHCDRLGLMDQGRLVAVGSPAELKQQSERRSGSLLAIDADDIRQAHRVLLRERPGAVLYGRHIHLRSLDVDADHLALTSLLEAEGVGHVRVAPVPLSMDDTFIDFIRAAEAVHA